jgi:cell division septation protein DedD
MSSEHRNVLWIIASVSFVLVVVLAVGLWWFYPGDRTGGTDLASAAPAVTESVTEPFDPIEWVRSGDGYPALNTSRTGNIEVGGDVVIVYPDRPEPDRSAGVAPVDRGQGADAASSTGGAQPDRAEGTETAGGASGLTGPMSADSAVGSQTPASRPASPVVTPQSRGAAPQQGGKPTAPATGTAAPRVTSVQTRPQPQPAKPVLVNEYWIQVASVSSISRAEEVRDQLQAKGIPAVITSKVLETDTYYRVRIGPYTNKAEAEKFLDWIKKLEGFGESYISLVPVMRG